VSFLLDTNVVSEWVKPRPDPGLMSWTEMVDEDRTYLSVISLAELTFGVERLAPGRRRAQLERWLREELPLRFQGRILPVDGTIAAAWGITVSRSANAGWPIGILDAFLAATAQEHQLTLVTRNVSDFATIKVLNPWST